MPATSSPATALRYRDVAAAIGWLCRAFGFENQTVVTADNGDIDYAQLTCGRAMLMLGPVRDTPLDKLMKQPDEIGKAATQSCYLVVEDADAHHARAKGAGAEIVLDLQDDDFGGRGYTCRDPEGHIWMFGTYDPWQGKHPVPATTAAVRGGNRPIMLAGLAMTVVAALAAVVWVGGVLKQPSAVSSAVLVEHPPAAEKAAAEAKERAAEAAELAARELRAQLDLERAAKVAAGKASEDALKRVAEERRAREAAEHAAKEARVRLERERVAKMAADKANAAALGRAAAEQRAREAAEKAAEKAAHKARQELERERAAATAAEMAKEFALGRADEERLAREAAERAVEEARKELERERAAKSEKKTEKEPADADALKRVAEVQRALDAAQKQAAEAQRAREAAEQAAKEAREQLARERASKAAAWKVVGQLTRQLKQAQGTTKAAKADDGSPAPAPKKARRRPRPKKKAADPD